MILKIAVITIVLLAIILYIVISKETLKSHKGWSIKWVKTAKWDNNKYSKYLIYYSSQHDKYKLVCEGYKPKKHLMYTHAVKKLNELNSELCL